MKKLRNLFIALIIASFVATPVFGAVGDLIAKDKLSGSTDGKGIKVAATSTPGTTIHTSVAGTTNFDEVWIWAFNAHTAAVELTIEWGGTTDPDNILVKTIPKDDGLFLVIPGLLLQNGGVIKAFAGSGNVIVIYGYVNELTGG